MRIISGSNFLGFSVNYLEFRKSGNYQKNILIFILATRIFVNPFMFVATDKRNIYVCMIFNGLLGSNYFNEIPTGKIMGRDERKKLQDDCTIKMKPHNDRKYTEIRINKSN